MRKKLIIMFGSQISKKNNLVSDFDVGILAKKPLTIADRTRLSGYLAKKFNINEDKIDLTDLYTASPLLLYEVAKKGKLLEGNAFDFTRFQVRAWKIYQDTAKFRRLSGKMIEKYVKGIHLQKT
ncbi:MAG: hypothetical protein UU13_C0001G0014 [Candidatus Nomurabacteria bacterium GW2011_GWB1_40_7]|uniref:Polymerase beta nucleotidyltransferase domain-containing protein n=1 Tax=Candidatus Nomurabacteria bacterium GW2011_GWB1_40_7 TaxID=1618744 RepID=A0A0G0T7P7_9BACT|nr:MAG: hypothetical protein UU13_C0001G0014 [Candidatus Nomurabacteria bacterium GW2011_GWB1_40_7]